MLTVLLWLGTLIAFASSLGLEGLGLSSDLGVTAGLVGLVLSLVPTVWTLVTYYDWTNDYLIISIDQITHYEQHYIFSHETKTVLLHQVQNVGITIPNIVSRWLNVGEVIIDTAGQKGDINFDAVKNPRGIQDTIFELLGRPTPPEIAAIQVTPFERFLPIFPLETPEGGLRWHRHWSVLVRRITLPLLLNLGLLVLLILWLVMGFSVHLDIVPEIVFALVLILVWLAAFLWMLYVYEDWRNDYWEVTDTYIIDVDALPLISEKRRQARLLDIQNVQIEVPSIWAQLLNMGNVFAETAGQADDFEMMEITDPESIRKEIFRRRAAAQARQEAERVSEQEEFERRVVEIVSQRLGIAVPPELQPDTEDVQDREKTR
jgi:hypothetical protein